MKTLRTRLLFIFLVFNTISASVALLFYFFDARKENYNQTVGLLEYTHRLLLKDIIVFDEFLAYETTNPSFFELDQSIYLMRHEQLLSRIDNSLDSLAKRPGANKLKLQIPILQIQTQLAAYRVHTASMVKLVKKRGFKNFGLIGAMRQQIHILEKYKELNQERVLMLRRHEKDFLLRGQPNYVKKHASLSEKFQEEIRSKNINKDRKILILNKLKSYSNHFFELSELEAQLGLRNNTGMKQTMRTMVKKTQFIFSDLLIETNNLKAEIFHTSRLYFAAYLLFFLIGSIVASIFISKKITQKLSLISRHMKEFVESEFSSTTPLAVNIGKDEVSLLAKHYMLLRDEIMVLVSDFVRKVEERTQEISNQKDKIENQALKIAKQHDKLVQTNELIEVQHKSIIDSIRYAERIQRAVLPPVSRLNEVCAHNFIFYQPRDIISGDFYWVRRIRRKQEDFSIVVVADSTGHGVPGAMMTMLGFAFLNEIVLRQHVHEPQQILDRLQTKITVALNYKEDARTTGDGMDMSICKIDHNKQKLHFSGANRPLYIVRNEEITFIRGNNFGLGKLSNTQKVFEQEEITLHKGDNLYMLTDGYADQFGGSEGRKFMRKKIRKLLLEMQQYPMYYQKEYAKKVFEEWMSDYKQVDDVLLLGMRIE